MKNIVMFGCFLFFISFNIFATNAWDMYCIANLGARINGLGSCSSEDSFSFFPKMKGSRVLTKELENSIHIAKRKVKSLDSETEVISYMLEKETPEYNKVIFARELHGKLYQFIESSFSGRKISKDLLVKALNHLDYHSKLFNMQLFRMEAYDQDDLDRSRKYLYVIKRSVAALKKFLLYAIGYIDFADKVDITVYSSKEIEKVDRIFKEYYDSIDNRTALKVKYYHESPRYIFSKDLISRAE